MNISSEAIDTPPNITVNNSRLFLVLFLGVLAAIGPFVMDLYLPALPSVVAYFDTSMPTVQLSLTSCMVGLAVGQLIIGPLSDKYGRKMPLLICIGIFALSGIGIVMAENMQSLISFRFLQGISSAGGVVIARAAAADLYEGPEMARFFALLMSVNGVAPIIAPVIGSLLLEITDWRGVFVFQAGLGILLFMACLRFQESLSINKRHDGEIVSSYMNYFVIMKNGPFMLLTGVLSFMTAGLVAYIAASPFIFQEHYQLSSMAFSLIFSLNAAGFALGAYIASKISQKAGVKFGILSSVIVGVALYILVMTNGSLWLVEICLFAYGFNYGVLAPGASSLAIAMERKYAGSASAVAGFFPFLMGALVSPLVGIGDSFVSTGFIMFISTVLAFLTWLFASKHI